MHDWLQLKVTVLRVMKSNDSKLALLLGTELFSLNCTNFREKSTNNEGGYWSIRVEVVPKGSRELFKLPLVT